MSDSRTESRLPVLFLGHGSPMNAIEDNPFSRNLRSLGEKLPRPQAILCVSAHWLTDGTWVTHMRNPKTIHDFYGFPETLHRVEYPAPGSPEIADRVIGSVTTPTVSPDDSAWGLDHGTWSVLRHLYPKADVPVIQLSIDLKKPPEYHFQIGEQLRPLRDQGILIVGSGNIVHNLRQVDFDPAAKPYDWAIEFNEWVKARLLEKDYSALVHHSFDSKAGRLSIPTPDHWLPLLYILGASDSRDSLNFDFEGIDHGSISMRCLRLSS